MTEERKRLGVSWRHYFQEGPNYPANWPMEDGDADALAYLMRIAFFNDMQIKIEFCPIEHHWRVSVSDVQGVCEVCARKCWNLSWALAKIVDNLHEFDEDHGTFHETFDAKGTAAWK